MKTEHFKDKSNYPPGPWMDEADRLEWRYRGMPCLIVRNNLGALCGYVGLPPGHPLHGKHYDNVPATVHGGLTYADACQEDGKICHVPERGEPADVWWVGFDCAHLGDYVPGMASYTAYEEYRDVPYVTAEVERLAEQMLATEDA